MIERSLIDKAVFASKLGEEEFLMWQSNRLFVASIVVTVIFSAVSNTASAARSFVLGAKVIELRTYGAGKFGSCVAQINKNVNTDGDQTLSCGNARLVSFGCDGSATNSKAEANAMFSNAQLALVTEAPVDVYINDAVKYNTTMCVAEFIYVK